MSEDRRWTGARFGTAISDPSSAAFFAAAARGEFVIGRDAAGNPVAPQDVESRPGVEWVPSTGHGRLVTWSTVPQPGAESDVIVGVVELHEGPWWWTQLVGVTAADLRVGLELRVDFARPERSEPIPVFGPAEVRPGLRP